MMRAEEQQKVQEAKLDKILQLLMELKRYLGGDAAAWRARYAYYRNQSILSV